MDATIAIRLSSEEKEQLQKIAKAEDLSMSQVVRRMIREFLRKEAEYNERKD